MKRSSEEFGMRILREKEQYFDYHENIIKAAGKSLSRMRKETLLESSVRMQL